VINLGKYGHWPFKQPLILTLKEARTHTHIIGVSGSGKSRYLASLYVQLLKSGTGVTLIDPHGDLTKLILGILAEEGFFRDPQAYEKLIYLDLPGAARQNKFLPFNFLAMRQEPHALASNVKEAFHRAYPELAMGAPMFDTLVQDGVKVLIENKLPLTSLYRLITDKDYRDALLVQEPDPDIRSFWHDQYDKLAPRDQVDQAGAALRRAHLLTFSPILKYSLGQTDNAIDFRDVMDKRKSLLINLALPDEEAKRLFGCLLTVAAEMAALGRAETAASDRPDHYVMLDEFATFTSKSEESLSVMLSQTRKYGLFSILAHQNWSQASDRLRGALQNCGLKVSFALEYEDAVRTAKILGRVDPRSIQHRTEEGSEGEGMAEQWQHLIQEIQDLKQGYAFVRKKVPEYPWFFKHIWHRPPTLLYKVKTPRVENPAVTDAALAAIEEEYLGRYFRPATEIASAAEKVTEAVPRFSRKVRLT
jgi:hypothetical protein